MRTILIFVFVLSTISGVTQTCFSLTAGVTTSHLRKYLYIHFTDVPKQAISYTSSPGIIVSIGISGDTIKWKGIKLKQDLKLGFFSTSQVLENDYLGVTTRIYLGTYSEQNILLSYLPKFQLRRRFYISPVFNITYRIRYKTFDNFNLGEFASAGVFDSLSGKNLMKPLQYHFGFELGMVFLKGKIHLGLQWSNSIFRVTPQNIHPGNFNINTSYYFRNKK